MSWKSLPPANSLILASLAAVTSVTMVDVASIKSACAQGNKGESLGQISHGVEGTVTGTAQE
jgi:hypothetical protein